MILSFRVSELHMLLGFAGRDKSGRKSELQNRAIELLQLGSYPVILKIKNLYKYMQESFQGAKNNSEVSVLPSPLPEERIIDRGEKDTTEKTTMQQPHGRGYPTPSCLGQPQISVGSYERPIYPSGVYHHQYPTTQAKQNSPIHPSHFPVHPDVKLKKLPFYEVSAELIKPSSLVPLGSQRQQDNTFVFHLTPQQAAAIGMSRDMRPGSKVEYTVQVQLRFCLLETTSEQEDCFPPGVIVKVNNKLCQLPNPIPTNKPGVEPKRPPRPVNITPLVKISPTVGNSIYVQWSTDYTRGYVVAVYLVHKKTSEDLLNRLKAKGVRGADYTRGMIKDKLNEDADSEIATTSLRVSLVCPLGKMRMMTPCRA
ncbi:sumo ligase, putative, partial [Pediculus humanus corporis]